MASAVDLRFWGDVLGDRAVVLRASSRAVGT